MPLELHLAKNMNELNKLASSSIAFKSARLAVLHKVAKSIYQEAMQNMDDNELTYVYAYRFLKLLEIIYTKDTDQRFVHIQYDTMRKQIGEIFTELQMSLPLRYDAIVAKELRTRQVSEPAVILKDVDEHVDIFGKNNDCFMSSRQLYMALQTITEKMLIIDIRPTSFYFDSKLNGNYHIINIDNSAIERGMSACKLEEKLNQNIKEIFAKRDQFPYILLMDNDTTKESFQGSKLKILFDMLTIWDINKNYERPPYVLDGGYVDFVDMYPTLSTNPRVSCTQRYSDLDDLLNLDSVEYPALSDRFDKMLVPEAEVDKNSQDEIGKMFKNLVRQNDKVKAIEEQMLNKDIELLRMMTASERNEHSIKERERLEYEREAIDLERITNIDKKNELKTEFLSTLNKLGFNEVDYLERPELLLVEKGIVEISRKRRKLMDEIKKLETDTDDKSTTFEKYPVTSEESKVEPDEKDANVSKQRSIPQAPISGDSAITKTVPSPEPETQLESNKKIPPKVNRANKPQKPIMLVSGLNGLVNIRNSCYMNSIIQCLRHIPYLRYFFISGEYKSKIREIRPKLILQFGDLVQRIWVGNNRSLRPQEFYNKIVDLHADFSKGHHEDANEFFMLLFGFLSDDVAQTVSIDRYSAQQQVSFYRINQQKSSFFIEQFFYQIRTDCTCHSCNKKVQKFDTENVLILNPPVRGRATLETLLDEALHNYDSSILYCKECEKVSEISRQISYQPRILSIMLKRYYCDIEGTVRKINTRCGFPLDKLTVGHATYKLWGICLHSGTMNAGHYTAMCLNVLDNKWYEFNDEIVRPIDFNTTFFEQQVYMLFYQIRDEKMVGFI